MSYPEQQGTEGGEKIAMTLPMTMAMAMRHNKGEVVDVTFDMKTAMREVASSGEEEPAAMRVAPATSGVRQSASETRVREGTKKSSQTTVSPDNKHLHLLVCCPLITRDKVRQEILIAHLAWLLCT